MQQIAAMTRDIVEKAKTHEHDTITGDFGTLKTPCPKCGSPVKETYKKFQCSNEKCDFALWKILAGRQLEAHEVEELIQNKVIGPLHGFRSRVGRRFSALIKLTPEFKADLDFGQESKDGEGQVEAVDFTGKEP